MKILNSVGRTSPDFKNSTLFLVKELPKDRSKSGEYNKLERAVSKQMKKKKKKNATNVYLDPAPNREEWYSLDKLVAMNQEKNEEIRRHIVEKGQM
jgi:hypothetical protein